jgi:hypothetical protein
MPVKLRKLQRLSLLRRLLRLSLLLRLQRLSLLLPPSDRGSSL